MSKQHRSTPGCDGGSVGVLSVWCVLQCGVWWLGQWWAALWVCGEGWPRAVTSVEVSTKRTVVEGGGSRADGRSLAQPNQRCLAAPRPPKIFTVALNHRQHGRGITDQSSTPPVVVKVTVTSSAHLSRQRATNTCLALHKIDNGKQCTSGASVF